jgi:hypothetical protein
MLGKTISHYMILTTKVVPFSEGTAPRLEKNVSSNLID